jgi:hypothetical protein
MTHSTSLSLDLSDHLLGAQREIHYVRTRLADTKDTLRARQRMQARQDSDFYSQTRRPGLPRRLELALARSR